MLLVLKHSFTHLIYLFLRFGWCSSGTLKIYVWSFDRRVVIHPRDTSQEGVSDEFGNFFLWQHWRNGFTIETSTLFSYMYLYIYIYIIDAFAGQIHPFEHMPANLTNLPRASYFTGVPLPFTSVSLKQVISVALVVHLRSLLASVAITYQTRIRFDGGRWEGLSENSRGQIQHVATSPGGK